MPSPSPGSSAARRCWCRPGPGLTNALGCLVADLRQDLVRTINVGLDDADMSDVAAIFAEQRARGEAINGDEAHEIVETVVQHSADMQFRGQTHLIRIARAPRRRDPRRSCRPCSKPPTSAASRCSLPEIRAVVVNLNTSVIGRRRPFSVANLMRPESRAARLSDAEMARRAVYADGAWRAAPVYGRDRLPLDAALAGPAIIQQIDATTMIEPGATARVDALGNLRIAVGSGL
jgi:N-methylhydantoinase A